MDLLQDFILVLLSAVVVLVILSKIKVPSVIGFLITGILIGTFGSSFIETGHELDLLAEIGVILLMFNIGLEFSLSRIKQMRHQVLVYGGLQVLITIGAAALVGFYSGLSLPEAIFAAFIISLSSTAIVIKILHDNNKLNSPAGRIMLGILLFQDICIVPMIILTPLLSSLGEVDTLDVLYSLGRSFGAIILIFLLAKFLLPRLFDFVISSKVTELFVLLVIGLCFGLALLTYALGFSVALGAFIAGMILAESDFIHQIEADIKPLKTVFLSIFFITVGMLLNVDYVLSNPLDVISVTGGILILKILIITIIVVFHNHSWSLALAVGLGISQIGEFSFMLLNLARPIDLISENFYQLFLSSSVISMLITPVLIMAGEKVGAKNFLQKRLQSVAHPEKELVLIAGFGINGINLSRIFKALNIPYRIIDMNPNTVKKYRAEGENIVYGDITNPGNLKFLGVEKASMLVVAISDAEAARKATEISRGLNPDLYIIVRSEFVSQLENLYDSGANVVISQDFEASLQIATYVLKYFGIAEPITKIKADHLRKRHYRFFTEKEISENQLKIAELASVKYFNETYLAIENPGLIGKPLLEINKKLDEVFGKVHLMAIIRDQSIITDITEDIKVERMDTLIVLGEQSKLDLAVEYLDNYF